MRWVTQLNWNFNVQLILISVGILFAAPSLYAQTEGDVCYPDYPGGTVLQEPDTVEAQSGALNVALSVKMELQCVSMVSATTGTYMSLRNYYYAPLSSQQFNDLKGLSYTDTQNKLKEEGIHLTHALPSVTLKLSKAMTEHALGDRLNVLLINELPQGGNDCQTDSGIAPNCFHGPNITNLHYHGTHVSPQPHQDYIYASVDSNETFATEIDPLTWDQPEGTHWYHPHKHGSTALQVGNGMAGTLMITGPFDTWLNAQFAGNLDEKLLVIQEVQNQNQFGGTGVLSSPKLVNGQYNPKIFINQGEVQRWRFVNATMKANSQLDVVFPEGVIVKQIAMDGVRFAPENYVRQPLVKIEKTDSGEKFTFNMGPGNRADFLVQAPVILSGENKKKYDVGHKRVGNVSKEGKNRHASSIGAVEVSGSLFSVHLTDKRNVMRDINSLKIPPMPAYLQDLADPGKTRAFSYEMLGATGGTVPLPDFSINASTTTAKFNPSCVNTKFSVKRNETVNWEIWNKWFKDRQNPTVETTTGLVQHPFHIHINPFQVLDDGVTTYSAPYVWQDTIDLPTISTRPILLRQKFTDYTGGFVQHCHILGHEDRGMMANVQVICEDSTNANPKFGTPVAGGPDNCMVPSQEQTPLPVNNCPTPIPSTSLLLNTQGDFISMCLPPGYKSKDLLGPTVLPN